MRACGALLIACALTTNGCLPLAIAQTKQEVVAESDITTRASSESADIDGTYCFVDHQVRTTRKAHVSSWFRIGGLFNAVLFGLGAGSASAYRPVSIGIAVDGLLAFIYGVARQNRMSTRVLWQPTTDTTPCAH